MFSPTFVIRKGMFVSNFAEEGIMVSYCSNCGVELPDTVNFCSRCGRPSHPEHKPASSPSIKSGQLILNQLGEFLHQPHFDIRKASQNYPNIAAVLAGFAFAAVILVMQNISLPHSLPNAAFFRDWATIAFLFAFFSLLLSAFVFSVVSGEEILAPRSNIIAFFGGIGFSISASLMFWGLVTLTKIFLDAQIILLASWLFCIFTLVQPTLLVFTLLDNMYLFGVKSPAPKEWLQVSIPAFIPLVIALLLKLLGFSFAISFLIPVLWLSVILAGAIILISSILALIVSDAPLDFSLSPLQGGLAIGLHSIVLGVLILTI